MVAFDNILSSIIFQILPIKHRRMGCGVIMTVYDTKQTIKMEQISPMFMKTIINQRSYQKHCQQIKQVQSKSTQKQKTSIIQPILKKDFQNAVTVNKQVVEDKKPEKPLEKQKKRQQTKIQILKKEETKPIQQEAKKKTVEPTTENKSSIDKNAKQKTKNQNEKSEIKKEVQSSKAKQAIKPQIVQKNQKYKNIPKEENTAQKIQPKTVKQENILPKQIETKKTQTQVTKKVEQQTITKKQEQEEAVGISKVQVKENVKEKVLSSKAKESSEIKPAQLKKQESSRSNKTDRKQLINLSNIPQAKPVNSQPPKKLSNNQQKPSKSIQSVPPKTPVKQKIQQPKVHVDSLYMHTEPNQLPKENLSKQAQKLQLSKEKKNSKIIKKDLLSRKQTSKAQVMQVFVTTSEAPQQVSLIQQNPNQKENENNLPTKSAIKVDQKRATIKKATLKAKQLAQKKQEEVKAYHEAKKAFQVHDKKRMVKLQQQLLSVYK